MILWILRQINKVAQRSFCKTFGDVAYLNGMGPCERCVGKMVQVGLPTSIDLDGQEVLGFVSLEQIKQKEGLLIINGDKP